jgi:hypothetical protein
LGFGMWVAATVARRTLGGEYGPIGLAGDAAARRLPVPRKRQPRGFLACLEGMAARL